MTQRYLQHFTFLFRPHMHGHLLVNLPAWPVLGGLWINNAEFLQRLKTQKTRSTVLDAGRSRTCHDRYRKWMLCPGVFFFFFFFYSSPLSFNSPAQWYHPYHFPPFSPVFCPHGTRSWRSPRHGVFKGRRRRKMGSSEELSFLIHCHKQEDRFVLSPGSDLLHLSPPSYHHSETVFLNSFSKSLMLFFFLSFFIFKWWFKDISFLSGLWVEYQPFPRR